MKFSSERKIVEICFLISENRSPGEPKAVEDTTANPQGEPLKEEAIGPSF
jgi:hypothetical protein